MATDQESNQKAVRVARGFGLGAIFVAILPVLIAPPLMDTRFWFIKYVSSMNYSVLNIYSVWLDSLKPGRFVPISDFYGLLYSFLGHNFLHISHSQVNYIDTVTKLILIALVFVALRALFREISKSNISGVSGATWETYPIVLFIVWGLGLNIFWKFNGSVAYPLLIYTVFLISTLFALCVLKHLRNLVATDKVLNAKTLVLLILSSLWANFYYELAYSAIAAIVVTILVAPIPELSKKVRIKLTSMFLLAFAVVWLPMRWKLTMQCDAQVDLCYSGSQLDLKGAPLTFIQNLVNPIPLADSDSLFQLRQGGLPFVFSAFTIMTAILIAIVIVFNIRTAVSNVDFSDQSDLSSLVSSQWRFTLILLSMGASSAAILSVSARAHELVDWGNSYRHTPILWMAYASLCLLGITWIAQRTNPIIGTISLVIMVFVITTGQWGRSWSAVSDYNSSFEPISRLYHELYLADMGDSHLANARRCLIFEELSKGSENSSRYLGPADKFMQKYHGVNFCVN